MTQQNKAGLRAWAREIRERQSQDAAVAAGLQIAGHLRFRPIFCRARIVAAYLSLPGEVSTGAVLALCHEDGKQIAVPAWDPDAKRYGFCAWTPAAVLRRGPMRVPEPADKAWIEARDPDLILVPGLVFDRSGGRIGFGAGHYDRLLGRCRRNAPRVGLAYDWQVVDRVPQEAWDERMDAVAAPFGWIATADASGSC